MSDLAFRPAALLISYSVLVFLSSLTGGWVLMAVRMTHERLQTAVSFLASLMLGNSLLHFVPHSVHELQFHSHDRIRLSLALLAGIGVAILIGLLEHSVHDHGPQQAIAPPGVTSLLRGVRPA